MARKRELWESEELGSSEDEGDEIDYSTIKTMRALIQGMDHEYTVREMARLSVGAPFEIHGMAAMCGAWGEQYKFLMQ